MLSEALTKTKKEIIAYNKTNLFNNNHLLQGSASDSEDSLQRTALEDTLDADPLAHTVLSEEVLRSPQTMRALEKFRQGARKDPSSWDG